MHWAELFRKPDVNEGVKACRAQAGAVLVDVRTPEEYARGRIPQSVNLPLGQIHLAGEKLKDKQTPLYVYCLSGGRSRQAAAHLTRMGYTQVRDIGGISQYKGRLEG